MSFDRGVDIADVVAEGAAPDLKADHLVAGDAGIEHAGRVAPASPSGGDC